MLKHILTIYITIPVMDTEWRQYSSTSIIKITLDEVNIYNLNADKINKFIRINIC